MSKALAGKVALVTGGSRGIGAAIAVRLAEEGADVAISYSASPDRAQQVVREIESKSVRGAAFQADQADSAQVTRLVKTVAERFGRLDILVNNAGVFVTGSVEEASADTAAFDRLQAVNVGGVVAAVRAAVSLLPDQGRIITIGSAVADRVPLPGMADYVATKAALDGYTRGWARDLGARGITVNLVQPGAIDTEMNPASGDFAPVFTPLIPVGRYGKPEEIAAAVAFLAGPEAGYISGTTLNVDGAFSV